MGLSEDELHQRQVYKRVLEFEQENVSNNSDKYFIVLVPASLRFDLSACKQLQV